MVKRNLDVPWSYSGDNGPEHWHQLCDWYAEGAQFPLQSPIHIEKKDSETPDFSAISFHYHEEAFTEKEFKNTIHFVPFECTSYVTFKDVDYHLTDIHYHIPSEHWLDGAQAEIEIHLVHMDEEGNNLVVGVLCEIVPGILPDGPLRKSVVWDLDKHYEVFDPALFLPTNKAHYHYVGSLTTPPTKGPINWFVFEEIGQLSQTFLSEFEEEILKGNNRPLQERKDRAVYYFPTKD